MEFKNENVNHVFKQKRVKSNVTKWRDVQSTTSHTIRRRNEEQTMNMISTNDIINNFIITYHIIRTPRMLKKGKLHEIRFKEIF